MTDGNGRYDIINLRPGTYQVAFSLPGFRGVLREGIVLEGAFAARVNAELAVGSVEETITVSGASPVVDVQSTPQRFVANEVINRSLPVGRHMDRAMSLVPGVSSRNISAGGSDSQNYSDHSLEFSTVHGSTRLDQARTVDGHNVSQMLYFSESLTSSNVPNDLTLQEVVYETSSHSAETPSAGVRLEAIPKEGSNTFTAIYRFYGSNRSLMGSNLTPALAEFISAQSQPDFNWESNVALGGPILEDKLWYFGAVKFSQFNTLITNTFLPDGSQADTGGAVNPALSLRLTYQATQNNKFRVMGTHGTSSIQRFNVSGLTSPEANTRVTAPINYSIIARWTSVLSSRLLFEFGQSLHVASATNLPQPELGPFDIQKREGTTGFVCCGAPYNIRRALDDIWHTNTSLAYVTGSHQFKVGLGFQQGTDRWHSSMPADMARLNFLRGEADSVVVTNTPVLRFNHVNANMGVFVQDAWTIGNRLTLNMGARWDHFDASVPAQENPAGNFVPARSTSAIPCVPCWDDWSVRLGVAYDLFGNGKTALKVSVGKFLETQSAAIADRVNPMGRQTNTRNWIDLDGNGTTVDENGNVQYDEIGPSTIANFGLPGGTRKIDPDLPRGSNWEGTVSITHELLSGVSVSGGFYRRNYYHLALRKNLAIDPDTDWTPFTITAPMDPKLPGGGGEVITQYNLNIDKLGVADLVESFSTLNTAVYTGFEGIVNARLPRGGFVFSSFTTERTARNTCDVASSDPNNLRFCDQTPRFRTLFKVSGGYPLPYDFFISGTIQLRPGATIGSRWRYRSAQAGVPLTGGGSRVVVLIDPTTDFYPHIKQIDLKVARTFQVGQTRVQAFAEIFNLPNISTILTRNRTVGPRFLDPLLITQPRRFQLGAQVEF